MEKRHYRIWCISLILRYIKGGYILFLESEGGRTMKIHITEKKMKVFLDNANKSKYKELKYFRLITERKDGEGYSKAKFSIIPSYVDIYWVPVAYKTDSTINKIKFYSPK